MSLFIKKYHFSINFIKNRAFSFTKSSKMGFFCVYLLKKRLFLNKMVLFVFIFWTKWYFLCLFFEKNMVSLWGPSCARELKGRFALISDSLSYHVWNKKRHIHWSRRIVRYYISFESGCAALDRYMLYWARNFINDGEDSWSLWLNQLCSDFVKTFEERLN